MRRPRSPNDYYPVQVEPNNLLSAARHCGSLSAGRVGNSINSSGLPTVEFRNRLGFLYVFDVVPQLSGSRLINLSADADKSTAVTLMTSYDNATETERSSITGVFPQPPERAHALFVQFGAGNARHAFEIDVSEGSTANIPGSHAEVTLLDYTFGRDTESTFTDADSRVFVSHGNVAGGAHPFAARLTTKVFCPFQTEVDLADPPLFSDFLDDLLEANIAQSFVTVVP